jgi:hypothetical protein
MDSSTSEKVKKILSEFRANMRARVRDFKSTVQTTIHTHDEKRAQSIREKIDKR